MSLIVFFYTNLLRLRLRIDDDFGIKIAKSKKRCECDFLSRYINYNRDSGLGKEISGNTSKIISRVVIGFPKGIILFQIIYIRYE